MAEKEDEVKLPETNVEFVTRLMEYSENGAMAQLVVIQALDYYTKKVIEQEAEVLESMKDSMIDGPAWVRTCKEIQRKLDARGK